MLLNNGGFSYHHFLDMNIVEIDKFFQSFAAEY